MCHGTCGAGQTGQIQQPEEDWLTSPSRHPSRYWMKIGFKKDGTPVAIDAKSVNFWGGYYLDGSALASTTGFSAAGYVQVPEPALQRANPISPTSRYAARFAVTAIRRPTSCSEQMIERANVELNLDPLQWRRKW